MSERERLSNRRSHELFDFEAMGMHFTGSASRYDDGRLAELFLDNHKAGSAIGTLVRDSAIISVLPCSMAPTPKRSGARCAETAKVGRSARSPSRSICSPMM
jgi:hypothetical protein